MGMDIAKARIDSPWAVRAAGPTDQVRSEADRSAIKTARRGNSAQLSRFPSARAPDSLTSGVRRPRLSLA